MRDSFDEVPELYDRVRPGYPEAVFEDLVAVAGLGPGSQVLELGPGTGQATVPLARRGLAMTAVELGSGLAGVLRRNVTAYPAVKVVNAAFEEWELAHRFDAVVAATSWHWLDPAVRLRRIAGALHPGGALALISTHHVAGGDVSFFEAVQRCYETWMPGTPRDLRQPEAGEVPHADADELRRGGFTDVEVRRYERDLTYTTAEYRDLLLSYSGHRALDPAAREGLLGCIGELMESRHGGRIAKRYLTELTVGFTGR
jgi:SAM-dependent methyltransferase